MLVRLLGPIDVVDDGEVFAPRTPLRRTLLALLALEPGQAVPAERLLDQAWDGVPPASGLRSLRFHISKMRSELPGGLIETVGPAYRLEAETDVASVAVVGLRQALGMWRGDPLADVEPCAVLEHERQRLDELRLATAERFYSAEAASPRAADVIADLTRLCLDHPLREGLWASLIEAHFRSGNQAEALRAYERLRIELLEHVGVDPSVELLELVDRVLHQDESLRSRPARSMPTGTVTYLFAGVEGTTHLWAQRSDAMTKALVRAAELGGHAVESHGGYVFTSPGRSFAAVFTTADAAARAALAAQAATLSESWPSQAKIRLRMGVHTGPSELRDGRYVGPEITRASLIESAAHGGQIVASPSCAALIGGMGTRSLGRYHLRGEPLAIELSQIGGGDFPPPRAVPTRSVGRAVELLGRDDDLSRVIDRVEQERLVTITGAGGIGKTSLARVAAHRLAESGTEVCWCDLVSASPEDIVQHVAQAIGLASIRVESADVCSALSLRSNVTLVLDNCEHVVGAVAGVVGPVLDASDTTLLVTSRVPLSMPGETVVALGPLDTQTSAIDLFVREATRAGLSSLSDADRDLVGSICRQVDGIPLALELAAARLRTMSLVDVHARLDQLLATLGHRVGDDARHQTMTAAIEWSVEMLSACQRNGLGALAVFEGGFDLAAAEAVLAAELDDEPLSVLVGLVDHSLVEVYLSGTDRRYRVLEPIRQYAADQLWRDQARTRHSHLEHYVHRLSDAHCVLGEHDCMPFLGMLSRELANLSSAHAWALASGRLEEDLELIRCLNAANLHGHDAMIGRWALETAAVPGVELLPGWGAVYRLACAQLYWGSPPGALETMVARFATIQSSDPTWAWAVHAEAFRIAIVDGGWEEAIEMISVASDSADPGVRWHHYFWTASLRVQGSEARHGRVQADDVELALDCLAEGLDWAASIDARNVEALLSQMTANVLVRAGRCAEAELVASEAEELSAALGMTLNEIFAGSHRVAAALMNVEIDRHLPTYLSELLEKCIVLGAVPASCYLTRNAARLLAATEPELAALCLMQPDAGYADPLPPMPTNAIPDEARQTARRKVSRHSVLEVARMAADALMSFNASTPDR